MKSLILIATACAALPLAAGTSCEDLSKLALDKATIATAQSVAAGSFTPPQGTAVNVATGFCRVALTLKPSTDSDIQLEVWLPKSDCRALVQSSDAYSLKLKARGLWKSAP